MVPRRLPWLEVWGPGGKPEAAGCFCPPNLSALWETPPRNQPPPRRHGAGKHHCRGHRGAETAESTESHGSVCGKERKGNFQSSAGRSPLALFPPGKDPARSDHTCVRTPPRVHAPTNTHACSRRDTRANPRPRAHAHLHTAHAHVCARAVAHAHTQAGGRPGSAGALCVGGLRPSPGHRQG